MNEIKKLFDFIIQNSNNKILIKNVSGAFIIKGLSLVLSLFTLPAYMNYFNNNIVLGMWFTLLSVMQWIFYFDVGIGNGLRNSLTKAIVKEDKDEIKAYISSAYIMIFCLSATMIVVGLFLIQYIDWNAVLNVRMEIIPAKTLKQSVVIIFVGVMIQFVLKLVSSIIYALQKSAINNLTSLIISLLQLTVLFILPNKTISQNLINLSLAYILIVNVTYLVVTVCVFKNDILRGCFIKISSFNKAYALETINLGLIFLWAQVLHMLINLSNDFLITSVTSPEYEVEYSIYYRLFSLVSSIYMLAFTPLWSMVTKAQVEKDVEWLKKIYMLCNKLMGVGVICEFVLIIFIQIIINIWLGDNAIAVNYGYAIIFALYGSVLIAQSIQGTFASGFGILKLQCICYTIGFVIKMVIIYIGISVYSEGWIIVVISNILVIMPYCVIQPKYIWRKIDEIKV